MRRFRAHETGFELVATTVALWVIVAAGAALAAGYAFGVTPWNNPDEPAHYNYVKHVATTGELPELKPGDWNAGLLERLKSARFPSGEPVDSIRYEGWQPPLYYLVAAPFYNAASRLPLEQRVAVLRLVSVAISGVTVLLAFLAVRTIFPNDLTLRLGVAGFMAFLPMRSSIAGSISNDALAEMVGTLILLLLLQTLRDGLRVRQGVLIGAAIGLALITKMTLYGLVALAGLVMLLAPVARRASGNSRVRSVGIALAIALLIGGWWFARNALVYGGTDLFGAQRHDQVVVGQPRLERLDGAALSYLGTTLFKSFWGQFGWMGVLIDERLYLALGIISGLAALGIPLFAWRMIVRKSPLAPYQRTSLALLAAAAVVVIGQVLFYNLTFVQSQGRYLYPALLPLATFFVLGLREILAPIHSRLLLALAVSGLALLDFVCLTRYVIPYFGV